MAKKEVDRFPQIELLFRDGIRHVGPKSPHDGIEYRHVGELPGICVGSDGSVWSCRTAMRLSNRLVVHSDQWKRLATIINNNGYECAILHVNCRQFNRTVHSLVLTYFVGERQKSMTGRHLDGNKRNNRLENLEWGTYSQNELDKRLHGTNQAGSRNGAAKLDDAKVALIRELRDSGKTQNEIAAMFGVCQPTIHDIVRGKTWKHVERKASA